MGEGPVDLVDTIVDTINVSDYASAATMQDNRPTCFRSIFESFSSVRKLVDC